MKLNVSAKMMDEMMESVKNEGKTYKQCSRESGIDRWVFIAYKHFKTQKGKSQKEIINDMKLVLSRFLNDEDEAVIDI